MSVSRRTFLRNTTIAGAALVLKDTVKPTLAFAGEGQVSLAPYLCGMRMAATPASAYRAYKSKIVSNPETTTWVQLDLGKPSPSIPCASLPASERMFPGRDQYYGGEGFPLDSGSKLQTARTSADPGIDRRLHPHRFSRSRRQHHPVWKPMDFMCATFA